MKENETRKLMETALHNERNKLTELLEARETYRQAYAALSEAVEDGKTRMIALKALMEHIDAEDVGKRIKSIDEALESAEQWKEK